MLSLDKVGRYAAHDVRNITSWKVRLLCRHHAPYLKDVEAQHTEADVLLLLHRPKPSMSFGPAHQAISQPQVLHVTLL